MYVQSKRTGITGLGAGIWEMKDKKLYEKGRCPLRLAYEDVKQILFKCAILKTGERSWYVING